MKRNFKGISLVGLLVSCAIFTLMAIVMFTLIRNVTLSWRSIEDRATVQTEIRKIQSSLMEELRKSSFSSIIIVKDDYRHTIAFKTFQDPETGVFEVDPDGNPIAQGYILYVLLRSKDDPCPMTVDNIKSGDTTCPHKMLLKIDLTRTNDYDVGGTDTWAPLILDTEAGVKAYIPGPVDEKHFKGTTIDDNEYKNSITGDMRYIKNVYVVAKEILDFDVNRINPPSNPEVEVEIKAFKLLEAGLQVKIGTEDLRDSKYTISLKNSIIPQNP